jgi:hypothetical protein
MKGERKRDRKVGRGRGKRKGEEDKIDKIIIK